MPKTRHATRTFLALATTALIVFASRGEAHAANGSFISTFGNWSDSFNWQNGIIAGGENYTATFNSTSTVSLLGARTIGNLSFGAGSVTLQNGTVLLSKSNNDGCNIDVYGSAPFFGVATISAQITGNDGVNKNGGGTLYLNNALNSFTGAMWFQGGRVVGSTIANEGSNSSFGRAPFYFDNAGFLTYTGGTINTTRGMYLQGDGNIDVSNAATAATFTGNVGGAGGFGKYGDGDLVIPSTSTFTGNATVGGGTWTGSALRNSGQTSSFGAGSQINLLNDGTLVYTGATQTTNRTLQLFSAAGSGIDVDSDLSKLIWSGVIQGTGGFSKRGPGAMTISGANSNTYTGATLVEEGLLTLQKTGSAIAVGGDLIVGDGSGFDYANLDAAEQIADSKLLTVAASGTFRMNGFNETIGGLAGSGIVENGSLALSNTLKIVGDQHTTFSGTLRNGSNGGTLALDMNGTGSLTLTTPAAITGGVNVRSGRLKLQGSDLLPSNSSIAVYGGALEVGAQETTNSISMSAGSIEGGTLRATSRFEISSGSISANLGGNGYFEKNGGGDLTFSGVGTYGGYTEVRSGNMTLVGAERLPDLTALKVDGNLVLGGDETVGSLAGSGTLQLNGRLIVGDLEQDAEFSGDITGVGTLEKRGSDRLTLSGSSSHAATNILGGWLMGNTGSLHGEISISNNADVVFDQHSDGVFEGTISGIGNVQLSGTGGLTIQNSQITGNLGFALFGGTLRLPTGLNLSSSRWLGIESSATLEAAGYVSRTISGQGAIKATDDLFIGNLGDSLGFDFQGALEVGAHDVVVLDQGVAKLGTSTTLAAGGQLTALHGLELEAADVLSATGAASVHGSITNQGTIAGPTEGWLTLEDDVTGAGDYTGNVRFSDGFTPGNSPAIVTMENVLFDESSVVTLEIGGAVAGEGYDQIQITGTAQLNGALVLDFIDTGGSEFTPEAGDVFQFFAGDTTGAFDSIVLPELPADLMWDVGALATGSVEVAPVPPDADFDGDADVDGNDFLVWQRGLGTGPAALQSGGDANFDGFVDGMDLSAWQSQFAQPQTIAAAGAVPEPSTLVIWIPAAAILLAGPRWKRAKWLKQPRLDDFGPLASQW